MAEKTSLGIGSELLFLAKEVIIHLDTRLPITSQVQGRWALMNEP
jgi:hypothetical protein